MVESDFRTLMPNRRFNRIKKPVKVETIQGIYNRERLYELFSMFNDYRDFDIKPWDVKGKYVVEDVNALRMMVKIQNDVDSMKARKKEAEQKTQQDIMEQQRGTKFL